MTDKVTTKVILTKLKKKLDSLRIDITVVFRLKCTVNECSDN